MSISVTFNGTSYSIPEVNESNWEDLTDFLVALASGSATTVAMSFAVRNATTTPQTLTATDMALCMNVASASVVNLPAGTAKQFYLVADTSGAASGNNITLTPSGGQLINGVASYVIRADYGAVWLQFNGTGWVIVSERSNVLRQALKAVNNTTNTSFIDASTTRQSTPGSAGNLTSASATFGGTDGFVFELTTSAGQAVLFHADYLSANISAISDPSAIYLTADSGTGIYVSKSSSSGVVTFKNRMGSSQTIEIKSLTAALSSVTAWA